MDIMVYENSASFELLADDCKAIVVEGYFNSRWALIEMYHQLGERIATDSDFRKYSKGNGVCLSALSISTGIGERTLYRAVQLFEKYPDVNLLPEGKNITWNRLVTNYLPRENEEVKEHIHTPITICSVCKLRLS